MARQTKADRILNDAAMRVEAARIRERTAHSELNTARATLAVLQEAYDSLERELAPKPRKKAAQSQPAQAKLPTDKKEKQPDTDANCGICGNPKDHADHDRTYLKSHDFEAPKSVASATKRSSRKGAAANNTQSTEIVSVAAMSASGD